MSLSCVTTSLALSCRTVLLYCKTLILTKMTQAGSAALTDFFLSLAVSASLSVCDFARRFTCASCRRPCPTDFVPFLSPSRCSSVLSLYVIARALAHFAFTGPPEQVFPALDEFFRLAHPLGGRPNTTKTHIQQPHGEPTDYTQQQAADRNLDIVRGNHKYLGGYVGPDDAAAAQWLSAKLNNLNPTLDAITDPLIPASLAIRLAKLIHMPKFMYYARSLPM